jgi:murein DD-endopeptidase MepM/ murein hydrolase activator NlpD
MMRIIKLILVLILVSFVTSPIIGVKAAPPMQGVPPFGLPFATPPSPSTWFVTQYYGNTTGSYVRRYDWYGAGQGMHFGVDLSAKCGTEVVAIGDGIVAKVDASQHGAGPHNLMILHPDHGYASFYGHLLEKPNLQVDQLVTRGQVIGLTGDPDLTCYSRPHLHLEIRSMDYWIAYNPVALIDADWSSLALLGGRASFQRDLTDPRKWNDPWDQPDIRFGGEMLNDYEMPWPPDWNY